VPFTLVHTGKYRTADKLKTDTTKTKQPRQANIAKHSITLISSIVSYRNKTSLVSYLVASYETRPGNEVSLFYKAPKPTRILAFTQCAKNGRCHDWTMAESQGLLGHPSHFIIPHSVVPFDI